MSGRPRREDGLQRAGLPERESLTPTSSVWRLGRVEAGQPGGHRGLSGGLAGNPQAGPRRGATLPVLRGHSERRRPHPAGRTRRDT